MQKEPTKKRLIHIGILYLIIVSLINFLGFLITNSGGMPTRQTEDYIAWIAYMDAHSTLISVLSSFSFIIPVFLCISYITVVNKDKLKARWVNIPLIYSIFCSVGWILSFILELILLLVIKSKLGISIGNITITSLLNISEMCLFICTTTFLTLDLIHRKFILPKYFSEGNLTQIKGNIKTSTRILFTFFFLSVSIFPIFYLLFSFYTYSLNLGFTIERNVFIVLGLIIVFGIFILITFSNHFSAPVYKILNATKLIKTGKYDEKVDVVSCDDLGELADNFNDMALSLNQKTKKIFAMQDSMIRGMAVMVESRDNSTGGHINRTSDCVKVFIEKLIKNPEYSNLSESFCKAMIKAAPMHDLGKIAVDDAILRKPGRFTDEEYEIMKSHSAEGAKIVENVVREVDDLEFKQIAINVAHYHHEKWDGSGYPEKISGEQIPLEARIMALADVFDALVSKRCYKDSMSYDKAFQIIEESLGTHFDPRLGEVFIASRSELEALYNSY